MQYRLCAFRIFCARILSPSVDTRGAGQYHLDTENDEIEKRVLETRSMQMSIPLAFIARPGALDDARLKAQASGRHAFLAHFVQQPLTQGRSLPTGGLHQAALAALDDMDGMHKTDLIGIPVGLQC